MKRRQLLSTSALALLANSTPAAIFATNSYHKEYTWERYEQALASGKPFLLDFYAPW